MGTFFFFFYTQTRGCKGVHKFASGPITARHGYANYTRSPPSAAIKRVTGVDDRDCQKPRRQLKFESPQTRKSAYEQVFKTINLTRIRLRRNCFLLKRKIIISIQLEWQFTLVPILLRSSFNQQHRFNIPISSFNFCCFRNLNELRNQHVYTYIQELLIHTFCNVPQILH